MLGYIPSRVAGSRQHHVRRARAAGILFAIYWSSILFSQIAVSAPQRYDVAAGEITIGPVRLALDLMLGSGPAPNNVFKYPYSLCVDDDGRIFVADRGNKRVQVFDPEGAFLATIGGRKNNVVKLSYPKALAVDPAGRLFIGESGLRQPWLYRLSKVLTLERKIKIPYSAVGIGFIDERMAIATKDKRSNANIYMTDPEGNKVGTIDDIDPNEMLWKTRVNACIDPAAGIVLANEFRPGIRIFSSSGNLVKSFDYRARPFNYKEPDENGILDSGNNVIGKPFCYDVAVAPNGWIYLLVARDFARNESSNLFQFDPSGKMVGVISLSFLCSRLLIDKSGRFYFLSQMETGLLYRYRPIPDRGE